MDQNQYRDLIASEDGGTIKKLAMCVLKAVSCGYAVGVSLRNIAYDIGLLRTYKPGAGVISVGNITAGGTGKTPLVIWFSKYLAQKGASCAILTRGYKAQPGKLTDEPAILAKSCPAAQVVINVDRVAAAKKVIGEGSIDVFIMDDGFQHRRLGRDVDIIAVDATCPFGFGRLLPAGLLREPVKSIKRADMVIITRSDQVDDSAIAEIEETIKKIAPQVPVAKSICCHPGAIAMKGHRLTMNELRRGKVFAFCGIGNPEAFVGQLGRCGMTLVGSKSYNDHHDYNVRDIADIYEEAKYLGANIILTTQKDWVKAALLIKGFEDIRFAYLELELEFTSGLDKIDELLQSFCPPEDVNHQTGQNDESN
ncbi:MAG: tetraacyldisaccharide 4'-kinase [Planctomycetes bacterium]|nr:tetraacyldisaccharide 4'-kinase [Planctomycetota bacterium]